MADVINVAIGVSASGVGSSAWRMLENNMAATNGAGLVCISDDASQLVGGVDCGAPNRVRETCRRK